MLRNQHIKRVAANKAAREKDALALRPRAVPVGRDWTNYEPAITRCVQFPGIGYMLIWAYRGQSVVKRSVKITNKELADAIGAHTFPLRTRQWPANSSIDFVEDQCIDDAEAFLAEKCKGEVRAAKRVVDKTPATNVSTGESDAPEKPSRRSAQAKSAVKPYAHVPVKAIESHVGTLTNAGVFPRSMGDRQFEQYAIDVFKPEIGSDHRLWGADLERALEAAGARPGDKVRIDYTGASKTAGADGKGGFMKHFVATVLESNS
jgi:hypothetical protein